MIEKKNIDRLFQEKFKDFEAVPSEKVWENIETELKEKKKRRVIPFWFRFAGAAAVLLLGGMILYKFAFPEGKTEGSIVNEDKLKIENNIQNSSPGNQSGKPSGLQQNDDNDAVAIENVIKNGESASPEENNSSQKIQRNFNNSNIKPENSVAGSQTSATQNNHNEATNDKNLRLVKKELENNGNETVASSRKKNKKTTGKGNIVSTIPEHAVAVQSDKETQPEAKTKQDLNHNQEKQLANQSNPDGALQENKNINTDNPLNDGKSGQNITGIAENTDIKKDSAGVATAAPNALEELLNEKENNVTAKEQKVNRWQITSNVAPIYFSSTSNGSPLDTRFEGNKKTYAPSISYGIGAKYAISKKFFIKSGVNSVSLEYNTSDVLFFQTENARRIQNVRPNLQGSLIQVDNVPVSGISTLGRSIRQFSGDLNQRISYVEVPVEMSYRIIDRKFGMELIGGLSTLILNQNEVSLHSSGMEMNIGEANNLNDLHFSTNVGVGFKYSFLKRFEANFEPMFKYQINTFSNDAGNFKPYFFGLYSGISYRF